jgi:PPE-repeat protein
MDFGLLPPEINSGRLYAGPGSGPMLIAAAAWDSLADELSTTASGYQSVLSGLVAEWRGPSSAAMAAASTPYTAWMSATAAQAEQTADRARAAAAAYETAFAATVPPPVIAANRAQLMVLITTNFFGQNTPAIMATEANYAEMWAQDAAAMYEYAGFSSTATHLTPFSAPPPTTNPDETAGQAAAMIQATGTGVGTHAQGLHGLASPAAAASTATTATDSPSLSTLSAIDSFVTGPFSPTSLFKLPAVSELLGAQGYLLPQAATNLLHAASKGAALPAAVNALDSGTTVVNPIDVGGVSADIGRGGLVGGMSVPRAWVPSAPAIQAVAAEVPQTSCGAGPTSMAANSQGSLFGDMALSSLAGRATAGIGHTAPPSTNTVASAVGAESDPEENLSNIFVISEVDE